MSWRLAWHPAALHGFHALPMRVAERLDAAVLRFAQGHLDAAERVPDSRLLSRLLPRHALPDRRILGGLAW